MSFLYDFDDFDDDDDFFEETDGYEPGDNARGKKLTAEAWSKLPPKTRAMLRIAWVRSQLDRCHTGGDRFITWNRCIPGRRGDIVGRRGGEIEDVVREAGDIPDFFGGAIVGDHLADELLMAMED